MSKELKSCHCGGYAKLYTSPAGDFIRCAACGFTISYLYEFDDNKLIEEWNRRAQPDNSQWISVKDRLPDCTVIGCDKWGNVEPVLYISALKKWKIMPNADIEMDVSYWQPLPEPPKEDNNAANP